MADTRVLTQDCKICHGKGTIQVKHGTIYITDDADEIKRAFHNEKCNHCVSPLDQEQELATLREQLAAAKKPWSGALQLQLADMTKERDQARAERDLANEKIADLQCDVANLNDRLEKQPANDENFILLQNNLLAVIDERDQAKRDKERLLSALNGLMNAVDADQSQLDKTSAFDSAYRRANEAIDASMENKTDE